MAAVVKQAYLCVAQGNIDGMFRLCADDIEYWHLGEENAIPFAGTYKGKDAFKGLLEKADKYFKTEEMDAEAFIESKDGKTITVPGVSTVTPRTQGGSTEHSSRSTSLDQVVIWEVVDDKITKCCEYVDTWKLVHALPDRKDG